MNEYGKTPEQEFADFMLNMTPEEFDEWADESSIEEILEATALIARANEQLREQIECVQQEEEYYIEEELEYGYFPEAMEVLSKFTLH